MTRELIALRFPGAGEKEALVPGSTRICRVSSNALPTPEQVLRNKRAELENPAIGSDGPKLAAQAEMEVAQRDLDVLYMRWAELEERAGSLPDSRGR
jgi:hypothetical protein